MVVCEACGPLFVIKGVDLLYLPEFPFDMDTFVEKIGNLLKEKNSIVVAVSEGIRTAEGKYVFELTSHTEYTAIETAVR